MWFDQANGASDKRGVILEGFAKMNPQRTVNSTGSGVQRRLVVAGLSMFLRGSRKEPPTPTGGRPRTSPTRVSTGLEMNSGGSAGSKGEAVETDPSSFRIRPSTLIIRRVRSLLVPS